MQFRLISPIALIATAFAADAAFAQRVTVQQPVFRRFTVGTTVSVPDRGSALLGGISRAGDSRTSFGPYPLGIPAGRSIGQFREHAGATAHVWIHDFEEMDRHLLNQAAGDARATAGPKLSGPAEQAYQSLLARHGGAAVEGTGPSFSSTQFEDRGMDFQSVRDETAGLEIHPTQDTRTADARADKFYQLGLEAAEHGKTEVARIHFRLAAKHGSRAAEALLQGLDASALAADGPAPTN